ncbi:MAG: hypothetical protein QM668_07640 [Agriterribacter sp.]
MHKKDLLINPYFIPGLLLLLFNDFYLKQQIGNWLTGKLSDIAGLFIFPVFFAAIFPICRQWIATTTGLLFIVWKTPFTEPIINFVNTLPYIGISRVVDYSDYIALGILPFSHYLILQVKEHKRSQIFRPYIAATRITLLSLSAFAFCATSMPRRYEMPKGTIYIGKKYTIKLSKGALIQSIKDAGYNCDYYPVDPASSNTYNPLSQTPYYQTNNIILTAKYSLQPDTILNVKYSMWEYRPGKTRVEIINVTLPQEGNIQNWKTLKHLSKHYNTLIKKGLIEKID